MAAPQNYVSVSRRPPDVEDYIDMLRRYRSWVIGPTFAGLVISVVVAFFWPNMYVCTASMRIRPSAVSNNLMPVGMAGQMQQRLTELQQEILGRDNLIILIKNPKLDLYEKERKTYSVEDVAEETFRKHVQIIPFDTSNAAGAQAFRIVFSYPDKYRAQKLVVELISEFQDKIVQLQSRNANSQSTLFDDLVKTAKDKLDKAQNDLADFTSTNQGRLPENFEANTLEVNTKQAAISQVNEKIGDQRQKQTLLDGRLSTNKNMQGQVEANLTTTVSTSNQQVTNTNLINVETRISNKREECVALSKQFQDGYPKMQTCKEQLKGLEDEKVEIEKAGSAPSPGTTIKTVPNPQAEQEMQRLRAEEQDILGQIRASVVEVGVLEHQLAELNTELKQAQDKINASPPIIQKYSALNQELLMAKNDYQAKSLQKEQAGTQQSMEEHHAGETLEILENPILPEKPTQPIRGVWVAVGTIIGLVLGVALAGAKEVKNTSLKNLKDVRAYTNLPVLSSVPLLENALLVRRKRRLAWLAWSSAVIVGSVLMSGAVYYYYFMSNQV